MQGLSVTPECPVRGYLRRKRTRTPRDASLWIQWPAAPTSLNKDRTGVRPAGGLTATPSSGKPHEVTLNGLPTRKRLDDTPRLAAATQQHAADRAKACLQSGDKPRLAAAKQHHAADQARTCLRQRSLGAPGTRAPPPETLQGSNRSC